MKSLIVAALVALPVGVWAEDFHTATLIDTLGRADLDAEALVATLDGAGWDVVRRDTLTPLELPLEILDPFYYYLTFDLVPEGAQAPVWGVTCSRIGRASLPHLMSSFEKVASVDIPQVVAIQAADTIDFVEGIAAHMACEVLIIPLEAPMPERGPVEEAIRARFDTVTVQDSARSEVDMMVEGSILMDDALREGEVRIDGSNAGLSTGRAARMDYMYRSGGVGQDFRITSYFPG